MFYRKFVIRQFIIFFTFVWIIFVFSLLNKSDSFFKQHSNILNEVDEDLVREKLQENINHRITVQKFMEKRKYWNTSNLGTILFKNGTGIKYLHQTRKRPFKVMVLHWNFHKSRHINNYGSDMNAEDILNHCSVKNCIFTGKDEDMADADAVIINMIKKVIPEVKKRNPRQIWVFLDDESPMHLFSLASKDSSKLELKDMGGIFNWTMTYRHDSDVPVVYGRTVPRKEPIFIDLKDTKRALKTLVPFWNKKQFHSLANILVSNCIEWRMNIVDKLKEYLNVDVFGACSSKEQTKKICPGHFKSECNEQEKYLFYLALENSKCKEYITEKLFFNAYAKGAIPIIAGPSLEDCEILLPPHSYLHVDSFKTMKELAKTIKGIAESEKRILSYHAWRRNFEVLNEHGYFGTKSFHYCRICEALNYNEPSTSAYDSAKLLKLLDKKNCNLKF